MACQVSPAEVAASHFTSDAMAGWLTRRGRSLRGAMGLRSWQAAGDGLDWLSHVFKTLTRWSQSPSRWSYAHELDFGKAGNEGEGVEQSVSHPCIAPTASVASRSADASSADGCCVLPVQLVGGGCAAARRSGEFGQPRGTRRAARCWHRHERGI